MAQHLPWLRPTVIVLILARCMYSWWLMVAVLLSHLGINAPLGVGDDIIGYIAAYPILQAVVWATYVAGYTLTGWFVFRRSALALPVAIFSLTLDILYWVATSDDPNMFQLSRLVELGVYGLRDLILNMAGLLIVIGVLILKQTRQLR
jgi:hypothetical protein